MRTLWLGLLCACWPDDGPGGSQPSPEPPVDTGGAGWTGHGWQGSHPDLTPGRSGGGGDEPAPDSGADEDSAVVLSAPDSDPADSGPLDSGPPDTGPLDSGAALDSADSADSSGGVTFTDETDVIVVGSGPAGMAAAISAQHAGARVVVFERAPVAAEGVVYAGLLFGAQTRWQRSEGVSDTTADAIAEWDALTGVDGSAPAVSAYIEGTAATLDWLDTLGVSVTGVKSDPDCGSSERLHSIDTTLARAALLSAYTGELRTGVEVLEPVIEAGAVVGVTWQDRDSGATGATRAGAVVIASGGFLRDRDRVNLLRPELEGLDLLYETNPESTGGSLDFFDTVGAGSHQPESFGLYVHAIQDPDEAEGEALILRSLDDAILVDEAGARFIDEANARSLDLYDALPTGGVFAVFTDTWGGTMKAGRPAYNWTDLSVEEWVPLTDLATSSDEVFLQDSVSAVASAAGLDPDGLAATIDEVNAHIAAGETDGLGRSWAGADLFEDELWWVVKLTPGLAKGFGGVATDADAHVLDEEGEVIRGLYAAGEVAGMIPGGGAGDGFSGTVSACYYGGRLAGSNAAGDALR